MPKSTKPIANTEDSWCREGDLNPHSPFGPADFKSAASASFAIPARGTYVIGIIRLIEEFPHLQRVPALLVGATPRRCRSASSFLAYTMDKSPLGLPVLPSDTVIGSAFSAAYLKPIPGLPKNSKCETVQESVKVKVSRICMG